MSDLERIEREAKERRSAPHGESVFRRDTALWWQAEAAVDELIAMVKDNPLVAELSDQLLKCLEERDEARTDARDLLLILMKMVISPRLVDDSFAAEACVVISRMQDRNWR